MQHVAETIAGSGLEGEKVAGDCKSRKRKTTVTTSIPFPATEEERERESSGQQLSSLTSTP